MFNFKASVITEDLKLYSLIYFYPRRQKPLLSHLITNSFCVIKILSAEHLPINTSHSHTEDYHPFGADFVLLYVF